MSDRSPRLHHPRSIKCFGPRRHECQNALPPSPSFCDVVNANVAHNRLILSYANAGYHAFLLNWLAGLQALHVTNFIVAALDEPTWTLLERVGLQNQRIYFGLQSQLNRGAVGWYDKEYAKLMGAQPRRISSVAACGTFHLLVTDADVVWRRAPWPILDSPRRRHCEVQAMTAAELTDAPASSTTRRYWDDSIRVSLPHPQANCARCLNAGFLYLKHKPRVIELLRRWEHALRMRDGVDHNQKWLNWVLATGSGEVRRGFNASSRIVWPDSPTACHLEQSAFPNGQVLSSRSRGLETTQHIYAAHLNYALGLQLRSKACTAKSLGLWLLSDDASDRAGFTEEAAPGRLAVARARFSLAKANVSAVPSCEEGDKGMTRRPAKYTSVWSLPRLVRMELARWLSSVLG